jgi:uncharacterized protein (DUF58 family)
VNRARSWLSERIAAPKAVPAVPAVPAAPPLVRPRHTGRVDWARLNYVLIPTAEHASQRPLWPPRSRIGFALFRIYAGFTREGRVLAAATLGVGAFGGDVAHSQVYILFSVLASLVAACFVVARFLKPDGIAMSVRAAARVFVGEPLELNVQLSLHPDIDGARGPLRIHRPFLPYFGKWLGPFPVVAQVGRDRPRFATTSVRFERRGTLTLGAFFASRIAPFGLTSGPFLQTEETLIRVVPKPARVILDVRTSAARPPAGGIVRASRSGESMDLMGLRPYRPGDRIRDLSARAWARSRKPVVREYQEEFTACFGLILITRGEYERPREAAIRIAAGIAHALYMHNIQLGMLSTNAYMHDIAHASAHASYEQALDNLASVERVKGTKIDYDTDALLSRLRPHLPRLSTVVVLADRWGELESQLSSTLVLTGICVLRLGIDTAVPQGKRIESKDVEDERSIAL